MGDLRERLRVLDSVTPPDQWEEIRLGTPRVSRDSPSIGRRVGVAAAALLIFGGGLTLVALAFVGHAPRTGIFVGPTSRASGRSPAPSPKPVEVSAESKDGLLRCTVRLPSDVVEPGEVTGISYTLQNLGSRVVDYPYFTQSGLVIVNAERQTVWDSDRAASSLAARPFSPPGRLPPGAHTELTASDTPIRWPGPLTLRATCDNASVVLPPFSIDVAVPGPAPATAEAIASAVSFTGGLFDDCRPGLDGSTTIGLIHAPGDATIPPMRARCSATVTPYAGFVVVSLMFVTPPEAPPVSFPESLFGIRLPGSDSMEAARVDFVVTASAVREVVPLEAAFRSRPADRMARDIELRNGELSKSGESVCGGEGWGEAIEFISVCPA